MFRCLGHGGGRLLARGDGSGGDWGRGRDAGAGRGVLVERLADAVAAGEQDDAGHDAGQPPGRPAAAGRAGAGRWGAPGGEGRVAASLTPAGLGLVGGGLGALGLGPGGPRKVTPAISADTIADGDIHWIAAERRRLAYRRRLLSENESADFAGSAAGLETTVPCGDSAARTRRRLGGELATDPVGLLGEDDLAACWQAAIAAAIPTEAAADDKDIGVELSRDGLKGLRNLLLALRIAHRDVLGAPHGWTVRRSRRGRGPRQARFISRARNAARATSSRAPIR
jgi:hypothetical protein